MNKFAFSLALWAGVAAAASLESFTPQGPQREVRQVQARFSAPMAALGQADAPAPFTVQCGVPGNGHWEDERTWVFDLARVPRPGVPCRFIPRPGLAATNGEAVTTAPDYALTFAGPLVQWSQPAGGDTVDEDQAFLLLLNGEATPESLLAHVRCEIQGIHEQVPVQRIAGPERARLLARLKPRLDELGETWEGDSAEADPRLEVLRCGRTLPANGKFDLVWGAGVATASGQSNLDEQRLTFSVRDHFSARMRCDKENAKAGCMPLTPIRLGFSAPVMREHLDRITLKDGKGKSYTQKKAENAPPNDDSVVFPGPFPARADLTLALPANLVDDKGRELVNAARFPLNFKLAEHPPLLKFSGDFGIIERVTGGLLPLTVRNLEPGEGGTAAKLRWVRVSDEAAILDWQARVKKIDNPEFDPQTNQRPETRHAQLLGNWEAGVVERALPKPNGALAFEVVGVPLEQPGFYVVEAESRRLGRALLGQNVPMFVRTTALVTNLGVHFKWGAAASLAWVTRLDLGTPVADAAVAVRDCKGRVFAQATTDKQGMALIPQGLPSPASAQWDCPLMVSARSGDDLSFAFSNWDEGIETWRFGLPESGGGDKRRAHSVLDRVLFRPGDTVHMKHFLRDLQGFGLSYASKPPRTLLIEHGASNQRWFQALAWNHGAAESTWKVPEGARRSDYRLRLVDKEVKAIEANSAELEYLEGLDSGAFSVADFRVPLMKAGIDPVRPAWLANEAAEYDLAVAYLNGGGAKNLAVKLRAQLEPRFHVEFANYAEFDFAARRDGHNQTEEGETLALAAQTLKLDAGGAVRARVGDGPGLTMPHQLRVELEYADPNGEIQTVSRVTPWWPANVVLGLKRGDWARAGTRQTLVFQAADPQGRPVADAPVEVKMTLRQTLGYRERLAGGFYGYRNEVRETPLPDTCNGKTDARGRFTCTAQVEQGGEVLVAAATRDAQGRIGKTSHSFWVAGRDEWVFAQENHDRIDLIPEKKHYEPGQTARFQVRMPYRTATALVTVEREGVLDARVVTLSGKSPVLEIPIKPGWAPNVFVSALVLRGRNDEIKPGALVDLGRPAFKLGIAGIEVGQRAHQLNVAVTADRASYQVREKAKVRVKVRTPEGKAPPAGSEVTLAAVDEGLLELAPNDSWNLLEAMMAQRGYGVHTFTAQMQITGKRHFGKKALPVGGGGGKLPTRELFDTLLFWQARIALDANGEASVEVPLNDSLTAFRIVAIAASETRFGTGKTGIRSSQDLQLVSGLAPVLREGDRLQAYFTLRNGSERAMKIEVGAEARGEPADRPSGIRPTQQIVQLGAGESREIGWKVLVPDQLTSLEWAVHAQEVGGKARDALKVKQAVRPAVPVRVQSSALYRVEAKLELPVAAATGALPGSGELRATLAASLSDGQTQMRDFMRRYPYACLEQKTSIAIATRDHNAWQALMANLPTYLAQDGQMSNLLNFFPGAGEGSVALTAYVLAIAQEAGWNLPAASQARMETALGDFVAGKLEARRGAWENPGAGPVQRLAALEALSRHGRATPALIATIKPEPHLWASSALLDWIGILQRTPALAQRDALLKDAYQALEARFTYAGRRLNFNDEARDGLWWMMTSADSNAVRALLTLADLPAWKERLPKLASGALARQQDGRWNTTTANAWGSLALERYQQRFEAVKPAGKSYVVLGQEGRLIDWTAFPKGATAFLPLASQPATLHVKHEGAGEPYVSVTTLAAVPGKAPVVRGYAVSRELLAIDRKSPDKWSRGDVVRVRLTVDARDDMGWVVLEDPIPAGASILAGSGKRGSSLLTQNEAGTAWPAWQERLFDTYRAYYEWLPRGRHIAEYTLRLNSDGAFNLPPTRVEAMYAPELFGEAPNGMFEIGR